MVTRLEETARRAENGGAVGSLLTETLLKSKVPPTSIQSLTLLRCVVSTSVRSYITLLGQQVRRRCYHRLGVGHSRNLLRGFLWGRHLVTLVNA